MVLLVGDGISSLGPFGEVNYVPLYRVLLSSRLSIGVCLIGKSHFGPISPGLDRPRNVRPSFCRVLNTRRSLRWVSPGDKVFTLLQLGFSHPIHHLHRLLHRNHIAATEDILGGTCGH